MMETEDISEMLVYNSALTWLIPLRRFYRIMLYFFFKISIDFLLCFIIYYYQTKL
jgi:hypothetical protein